ncbi:translation initiation factor IF-2 [Striga asiatica]|uniref:Translation initiation factor IF-2 n=1 Tax=Striga asiatica TaxID=4170 RepID=A0A5A7PGH7_STRAF|nr:translation initiation factor IF-2 [Striga asiatica]
MISRRQNIGILYSRYEQLIIYTRPFPAKTYTQYSCRVSTPNTNSSLSTRPGNPLRPDPEPVLQNQALSYSASSRIYLGHTRARPVSCNHSSNSRWPTRPDLRARTPANKNIWANEAGHKARKAHKSRRDHRGSVGPPTRYPSSESVRSRGFGPSFRSSSRRFSLKAGREGH